MFAISILSVVLFAMIFMTVIILDGWNYCTLRNWGIIIFTSLFTIILWVLFLV